MRKGKRRSSSPPRDRRGLIAICWIAACFILGGASNGGVVGNLLLQISAAAIVSATIFRGVAGGLDANEKPLAALLVGLIVWIAITLIPMPPVLWSHLPGREFVAKGYRLMGMDLPWLPISLTDDRTVRSALSLLVPVASYLLVRQLDEDGRMRVAVSIVTFACLSVLLGFAQIMGGESSPLRPYEITNQSAPVGLFANTNHFATMLLAAIPLAMAFLAYQTKNKRRSSKIGFDRLASFGAAGTCIAGLLLIGSNAGLLLMVPAVAGAFLLGPWRGLIAHRRFALGFGLSVLAFGGLIVAGFASGTLTDKVGVSATSRSHITGITLDSARAFLPVGAGLGSFPAIYLMESGGQGTNREWMNHAHDDPAEVLLELGAPGAILMALFALWLIRSTVMVWTRPRLGSLNPLTQAASLGATLVALHCFVDYPLRSGAIAALFGALLALLVGRNLEAGAVQRP